MDTKYLQKQVSDIYAIVSALNVSGDAVDVVAVLRARLRKLNADIAELKIAVKEPPNIPTTAVAEPAKEAADDGGQNDR